MSLPRIAFCITCKGRTAHLSQTLPQNLKDNADYPNAVFVLVDYGGCEDLQGYLQEFHKEDLQSGRLVVYCNPCEGPFRMAHAKNLAHRCAIREGADLLVNLDADNFTNPGFATYIASQFAHLEGGAFLWAKMEKGVLDRGISGRIAVTAAAFLKVGGYDERFGDWGPDDRDFNLRLTRCGYVGAEIDPQYLGAVRHNDKLRFKEYPHAKDTPYWEHKRQTEECETTVVNAGAIGCAEVLRWPGDEFIRIEPVPTRIFGIGMHKTGTTSLHHALQSLGVESAHWKNAHWAKNIWLEMRAEGRSSAVDRGYAFSDLPFPLLFKELDVAYPGSRFILTTRSEEGWLSSVQAHWNPHTNKYRAGWDTDPFTHMAHKALYGRKSFDAGVFLRRYRAHNEAVRHYFTERPHDLIELNCETDTDWLRLCTFLGKPVPAALYPKSNGTLHAPDGP
jgi:hypothetical protein